MRIVSCRRKAFSLAEVILAVGVLSMALMALVGLLGSSFTQVSNVVQANRALSVVSFVNAALDNPETIGGEGLPTNNKPAFNAVYNEYASAVGENNKKSLYCFDAQVDRSDEGDARKGVVTIVVRKSGDDFSKEFYDQCGGVGPVFRVDISVSSLLDGQQVEIDSATYEPKKTYYSTGESLPADSDGYALAYLPLLLEVYSHDIGLDVTTARNRDMKPILSQNIAILR